MKKSDIQKPFEELSKQLTLDKKDMMQTIIDWRDRRTEEIRKYAADEKERLEKECARQRVLLENTQRDFVSKAVALQKGKDKEALAQLLQECRQLQFRLDDTPTSNNHNDGNQRSSRNTSANARNTTIINNDHENENASSSPRTTSAEQSSRRSSTTQTSPKLDHLTIANDNSKSDMAPENHMEDKCPVCFMMFPQNMIRHDREQHVNEHYEDD